MTTWATLRSLAHQEDAGGIVDDVKLIWKNP
jgi:hypothetical protein